MTKTHQYDLEERTFTFTNKIAQFCRQLPFNTVNNEYVKQVVRSAGSIGANYIEANESLSKKDFVMRIKICRKESKETAYWLKLIIEYNSKIYSPEAEKLHQEAIELKKIFSAIINKC